MCMCGQYMYIQLHLYIWLYLYINGLNHFAVQMCATQNCKANYTAIKIKKKKGMWRYLDFSVFLTESHQKKARNCGNGRDSVAKIADVWKRISCICFHA